MAEYKPPFSNHMLDLGELSQKALNHLGQLGAKAVSAVAGADAENYVQAQWRRQDHINPTDINWHEFQGDGRGRSRAVLPFPRLKLRFAAILGMERADLESLKEEFPRAVEAVTFMHDRAVRVATMPDGEYFGALGDVQYCGVGFRWDTIRLIASIGLFDEEQKRFVSPERLIAPSTTLPVNEFDERYPLLTLL